MDSTRFCVRCGRETKPEELINGLCIDCYLKHHGVFKEKPRVKVVVCPKCGSWYFKGVWHQPLDLREVIRRELLSELYRFLYSEIRVLEVDVASDIRKISAGEHGVEAVFTLEVAGKHVARIRGLVVVETEYKVCDKCMRRTTGSHKALVQVRFDPPEETGELYREVSALLHSMGLENSIVEVEERRDGMDVKFDDVIAARRYVDVLARKYGARTSESFKSVKYDFQAGKWSGVVTISVRIPVIKENDVVKYRGSIGVVKHVGDGSLKILLLETGVEVEARLSDYWSNVLRKPREVYVDSKVYTVTAVDKTTVYLLNEETGELREHPLTPGNYGLKPGDRVIILSDGEREVVVKKE